MASITSTQLHPSTRKQTTSLPTKPAATIHLCETTMDRLCPMRTVERGQLGLAPTTTTNTTTKPSSIATECAVRLDACRARLAMAYRISISKPTPNIPVIRTRHERVREPDTTPSPRRRASSFFVARPSCLSHVICQPEEMTESRLRVAPRKRSSDPDLRIKCLREHTKLIRAQKAKERAEKRALKEKEKRRERELEREKKLKASKDRKWAPATVQTTCVAVSAIAFPSIPEPEVPVVAAQPAPAPAPVVTLPNLVIEPPPTQDKVPVPAESNSLVASPSSPITDELNDLSLDWKKEKKQKMMKKKSAEALVESNNVENGQPASSSSSSLEVPTEAPARKRQTSGAEKSQGSSSSTPEFPEDVPVRKRKTSGAEKEKKSGTDRERKKSKPKTPVLPSIADEAPPPLPTKKKEEPLVKPSDPTPPKTPEKKCIIIVKRPPCIIVPLPDSMPAVMARPDSPTPRK